MIIRCICRVTRPLTTHSNTVYDKSDALMQSEINIILFLLKPPVKYMRIVIAGFSIIIF